MTRQVVHYTTYYDKNLMLHLLLLFLEIENLHYLIKKHGKIPRKRNETKLLSFVFTSKEKLTF